MENRPWSELRELGRGMSNFDFTVDEGVEEQLRRGDCYCDYTARDFFGYVWFDGEKFNCDVWRYGAPAEVITANTLPELMTAASEEYGYA